MLFAKKSRQSLPIIREKDILLLLKEHANFLKAHPNSNKVLTFIKYDWGNHIEQPVDFKVEVRFPHHNIMSLVRILYGSDEFGNVFTRPWGNDSAGLTTYIKIVLKQMEDDGYIYTTKQKCTYTTEHKKESVYDENTGESYEVYMDALSYFLSEDQSLLETAIILTKKGSSRFSFFLEKLLSEPIGTFSLIVSIVSIIISFWI